MKTITFTNQKGGVAKTTSVYNFGVGLNNRGFKVLLIDLDPQENLFFTAGIGDYDKTLYDVFKGECDVKDAIYNIKPSLDILPAGLKMSMADMEFNQPGREHLLETHLKKVERKYDYCIIDTPPVLNVLLMNALTASNECIIPTEADAYSIKGVAQLSLFIDNIKAYCNKRLKIRGMLVTKYVANTEVAKSVEDFVNVAAKSLNTIVFNTRIRKGEAVKKSQLRQKDLYDAYPRENVTADYNAFIDEYLESSK